jgi:hypothetical protein
MINLGIGIPFRRMGGGAANTARTQAFLTATGITDQTIISALNAMDTSLISAGLLPAGTGAGKLKVVYVFVGGSATTHKYNFVNPLDTNAANRIVFNGGFTHNSNGITPNGINAFCETFVSGANLTNNSTSWSFYSRTDLTNDTVDLGGANGTGDGVYCFTKRTVGNGGFISNLYQTATRLEVPSIAASTKLIGASRTNSTTHKAYRDGVQIGTTQTASNSLDITTMTTEIVLCAYRASAGGSPILNSSRNLCFAHIGEGLSDAEFAALNSAVVDLQTTLGRAV